tara:strand:+ start:219 stop:440 length:222 start_codon:yes stop_codon:yes gene_type:complete
MSREELKKILYAIDHNIIFKDKFSECKSSEDFIVLAKKYGFSITLKDLSYDQTAGKLESWFKESEISPLKYTI